MSLSLDRVTQVVMDGLVYYPFHFVETRSEHARKNWKVLRVVRREGDFFTIPTVFALQGSIEKKNCFKMEWYSFCSCMGPNQERIMDQTVSRLSVWPQVSFVKTGTYKGITVNSLYCGHCRDLELVSSLARVCNSGSLFQSYVCNLFLPGI